MNDPETPAEPPAPEPSGGGIPGLGGLDLIVRWAIEADPMVRYAVAALGVLAVGAIAIKIVPAIAGLDVLRSVLILFGAMIVLMLVFFLVAGFMRGDNPAMLWVGRVLSIILILTIFGLLYLVGGAWLFGQPCNVAMRLGFTPDQICSKQPNPAPNPAPTPTPTPASTATPIAISAGPSPTRLVGTVVDATDNQAFMADADVVLRRVGKTIPTKSLPTGDFEILLGADDLGREFSAFARKPCYGRGASKLVVIKAGDNEVDLPLPPDTSCGNSAPKFGTLKVEHARINPAQLAATAKIAVPSAMVPLRLPSAGTSNQVASWFDGRGWRFDIFYCQQPDGDPERSKRLAVQLTEILNAQRNVARVNVKLWPARGRQSGYASPTAPVTLNVRPERGPVVESLQRLWTPYLATGEQVGLRQVATSFPNYMSIVACRR